MQTSKFSSVERDGVTPLPPVWPIRSWQHQRRFLGGLFILLYNNLNQLIKLQGSFHFTLDLGWGDADDLI